MRVGGYASIRDEARDRQRRPSPDRAVVAGLGQGSSRFLKLGQRFDGQRTMNEGVEFGECDDYARTADWTGTKATFAPAEVWRIQYESCTAAG
jgi:hypothetical protein